MSNPLGGGAQQNQPVNLSQVGGTAQTGRDWSGDLDNLQGIPPNQEGTSTTQRLKAQVTLFGRHQEMTVALLGIAATFTGATYNVLVTAADTLVSTAPIDGILRGREFGINIFADQNGTFQIQVTIAGSATFRNYVSTAYVAGAVSGNNGANIFAFTTARFACAFMTAS